MKQQTKFKLPYRTICFKFHYMGIFKIQHKMLADCVGRYMWHVEFLSLLECLCSFKLSVYVHSS